MNAKKKLMNRGFTLVELMVVVAIIGILSAIAVPNFKKYQGKARRSEANVNLATIYTLEQSYYADNNQYSIDLRNATGISFDGLSSPAASRYYSIGFQGTVNTNFVDGSKGGATATFSGGVATSTTATGFKGKAMGYIMGNTAVDEITIDEAKTVSIAQTAI